MRGQAAKVLETASHLVQLFEARNIQPEALAALTMVYKAAQKETVSLSLIAQITELVRDTETPLLYHHSSRVDYFGDKWQDKEVLKDIQWLRTQKR